MRNSKDFVDNRRKKIMQIILTKGEVKVDELCEVLKTTPITIRRDLQHLEDLGLVSRFYGGVKLIEGHRSTLFDQGGNNLNKHAIAKYAASLVEDGDTIFINSSSTALLMLHYIKDKHVTVITNNGKAIFVDRDPQISVILSGGELRIPKEAMVGDFAVNNLTKVTATKSFLGCSGLSIETGMTTSQLQEVAINELMLTRCLGKRYILAEAHKLGYDHTFVSGSIDLIDCVITNHGADINQVKAFKKLSDVILIDPLV